MTPAIASYDRYLADFEALREARRDDPGWLRSLREGAMAHFQEIRFPTSRKGNEPWKYTNIARIADTPFSYALDANQKIIGIYNNRNAHNHIHELLWVVQN